MDEAAVPEYERGTDDDDPPITIQVDHAQLRNTTPDERTGMKQALNRCHLGFAEVAVQHARSNDEGIISLTIKLHSRCGPSEYTYELNEGGDIRATWSKPGNISEVISKTLVRQTLELAIFLHIEGHVHRWIRELNAIRIPHPDAKLMETQFPTILTSTPQVTPLRHSLQSTFPEFPMHLLTHAVSGSIDTEGTTGIMDVDFAILSIAVEFATPTGSEHFYGTILPTPPEIQDRRTPRQRIQHLLDEIAKDAPKGFLWLSFGGEEAATFGTTDVQAMVHPIDK